MSASPWWKLYGVPLSQPFRSVAWALLQHQVRFEVQLTVPGAATKIGSRNDAYRGLTRMRSTRIPLLQDTRTGFAIAESPAILSYLCDYYSNNDTTSTSSSLYAPPGTSKRATIDSYMHWHHTGTRKLSAQVFPYLRPGDTTDYAGKTVDRDDEATRLAKLGKTLQDLEEGWFADLSSSSSSDDCFLAGGTDPSIADLLAYEEIVQLPMLGLLSQQVLQSQYPKIAAWTERMAKLPFHEEVHMGMTVLGDVTDTSNETPFMKRLAAANKAALKALMDAQSEFPEETPSSKL